MRVDFFGLYNHTKSFSVFSFHQQCNLKSIYRYLVSRCLFSSSLHQQPIKKTNFFEIISMDSKKIQKTYSLGEELIFKKTQGGMINPPIFVFKKEKELPIGVFKFVQENKITANTRLQTLENLKLNGLIHLPTIFKNTKGKLLTKIQNVYFYFMEYLAPDKLIGVENFLTATGVFHKYLKETSCSQQLNPTKLKEYALRANIFLDPWFSICHPIFKDTLWEEIVELSQFFLSNDFQGIYQNLSQQLIHGDNNQTNIILSNGIPYFIDFDSLRFDVRILDLTSYFRYGGFTDYINLSKKNELFSFVNKTYGKNADFLSEQEEMHFHLLMAFSHIEFMSLALTWLKKFAIEKNQEKINEVFKYILLYRKQIKEVIKIGKELCRQMFP